MKNITSSLSFLVLLMGAPTLAGAEPVTPNAVVETMEKTFGVHHGYRRNHAKGFCAVGEFKATAAAKALSRSALFNGRSFPVVARFSSATGLPTLPDTQKAPHGFALQFDLGKAGFHNMSMINAPIFVAATPEAFFETFKLGTPAAVAAYQVKYPESKAFFAWMAGYNPPASYATSAYYSLNAFEFLNQAGKSQFVRWHFKPKAGEKALTADELAKAGPDYLEAEFKARAAKGAATWTMVATLAEPGDNVTNSTAAWPTTRKTVELGTLKLTKYQPQATGPCNKVNFDPNRVSDGVEPSDDPVLRFRAPAYAVSYGKRITDPVDQAPAQAAEPKREVEEP